MNLDITNNRNKAQETFLKQLEGLALARDILTSKNLNKDAECDTMTYKSTSCELSMTNKVILPAEAMQMLSNLESLKDAIKVFTSRNNNKTKISEVPTFTQSKSEPVELSASARGTFDRIGARAREAFVEDQIERANLYNIPYKSYRGDYYQLMLDIDKYEYLLEVANHLGISWDDNIYDPLALEQAIDDYQESESRSRDAMYRDYLYSRRVAI